MVRELLDRGCSMDGMDAPENLDRGVARSGSGTVDGHKEIPYRLKAYRETCPKV